MTSSLMDVACLIWIGPLLAFAIAIYKGSK